MLYKEIISPEMQLEWFHKINNDRNYFYIVQINDEYIGLANIKNIENNAGEPGFFLGEEKFAQTNMTGLVNAIFGEFLFYTLGIETLYIHVRKDNPEAVKLNEFAGFKVVEEKSGPEFFYMELTKATAWNNPKMEKLNKFLRKNIKSWIKTNF